MQDIADAAGINKAMLHYYFRSKNQLFERILSEAIGQVIPKVAQTLQEDLPLEEKFSRVSGYYHQLLRDNPHLPMFVLNALQNHPEQLIKLVQKEGGRNISVGEVLMKFVQHMQREVQAGHIEPIDPRHVLINLIGTIVFPFMMRPILTEILGTTPEEFDQFVQSREELVPKMIMQSIRKEEPDS